MPHVDLSPLLTPLLQLLSGVLAVLSLAAVRSVLRWLSHRADAAGDDRAQAFYDRLDGQVEKEVSAVEQTLGSNLRDPETGKLLEDAARTMRDTAITHLLGTLGPSGRKTLEALSGGSAVTAKLQLTRHIEASLNDRKDAQTPAGPGVPVTTRFASFMPGSAPEEIPFVPEEEDEEIPPAVVKAAT